MCRDAEDRVPGGLPRPWIHGELWLLPHGILRLALDSRQTRKHGVKRTVPDQPPTRAFDEEICALIASGRRNVLIPADRIVPSPVASRDNH